MTINPRGMSPAARTAILLVATVLGGCGTTGSAVPPVAGAPTPAVSAADSTLVRRILLAEDRRDSTDVALRDGATHRDPRVRMLARRAIGRIRDAKFAARDSLPVAEAPPAWAEPAWRLRYRALGAQRDDCGALRAALADDAWPVRLRAADLAGAACAGDEVLAGTLWRWVDALPADVSRREAGGISWHAAAHGIVALARLQPAAARARIGALAGHRQWQPRMYAARAAAVLADAVTLRQLARDANGNVQEAAIEGLVKVAPGDVAPFVAALDGGAPQAVRAAAVALKGTADPAARRAAAAALERWTARANASERDVRVSLLDALGRPASDDRPPEPGLLAPPHLVALALGYDVRLRVRMSDRTGGGSFVVRLRGDVAPMMAARILQLARAGYYDGLTWHRVEHDFVIQGGSPGASEYVGLAQFLRDELGTVPHRRGTVGMSTRGHDTGDAQWFVNLKDNLRLGSDYTVFAEVVEGIEVVDGIMEGDVIARVELARDGPMLPAQ